MRVHVDRVVHLLKISLIKTDNPDGHHDRDAQIDQLGNPFRKRVEFCGGILLILFLKPRQNIVKLSADFA